MMTAKERSKMEEFYTIYYLILSAVYVLLPGLFWLFSLGAKKNDKSLQGRVVHHKKELRGHAIVSVVLSGIMLSFLPFIITNMEESEGATVWLNGIFVFVFIGIAGFFLWVGAMGVKMNRRSLREAQAELENTQDKK
jgi:drug/metabolite transporter (DMT)-like permease